MAYVWTSSTGAVDIGTLPGATSGQANAVSVDGTKVAGQTSGGVTEAFIWDSTNGMVGLGDLAGGLTSSAGLGLSSDGSTVVGRSNSASGVEAFRWDSTNGMQGLGDLAGGSFFSEANDVSGNGSTVVGRSNSAAGQRAFIWDATDGMRDLSIVLASLGIDLTGWTLTDATGISDDGLTIVGVGTNSLGLTEGWIAVIPEPGTALLLGLGLAGLATGKRRNA